MSLLPKTVTATIANGTSLSGGVFLGDGILVAIQMPSSWTAADLTFQVSDDQGTTWTELVDDAGDAITVTSPQASERLSLASGLFASAPFLKVRSGTSGSAVAQGGARTLTLITRKLFPVR